MAKKQASKKVTTTTTTTRTTSRSSRDKKATSKSSKGSILKGSAIILAVVAALSYNFFKNVITDMGLLLGTVLPFNTEGCEPVKGLESCEDVHIHHASGLAFTTCGHAESRKGWYPPVAKNNASTENAFQDKFVIYNVKVSFMHY